MCGLEGRLEITFQCFRSYRTICTEKTKSSIHQCKQDSFPEDDVKTIGTKPYRSLKKSFRKGLLFTRRRSVYPQTFEHDTMYKKTIEKVETFEDDTETICHRLRVNSLTPYPDRSFRIVSICQRNLLSAYPSFPISSFFLPRVGLSC